MKRISCSVYPDSSVVYVVPQEDVVAERWIIDITGLKYSCLVGQRTLHVLRAIGTYPWDNDYIEDCREYVNESIVEVVYELTGEEARNYYELADIQYPTTALYKGIETEEEHMKKHYSLDEATLEDVLASMPAEVLAWQKRSAGKMLHCNAVLWDNGKFYWADFGGEAGKSTWIVNIERLFRDVALDAVTVMDWINGPLAIELGLMNRPEEIGE